MMVNAIAAAPSPPANFAGLEGCVSPHASQIQEKRGAKQTTKIGSTAWNQLAGKENPRLIAGHARLDGRDGERFRVVVGGQAFLADQVVLDTGTRSVIPPIDGIGDLDLIHAGNWLDTTELLIRLLDQVPSPQDTFL